MWLSLHDVDADGKYVAALGCDTVTEVLAYVSDVLSALTAYRYTEQRKMVENLVPIPNEQRSGEIGPYVLNGQFYNANCGSCQRQHVFKLSCVPAAHVFGVSIGGCELDPIQYCLVDTHTLVVTGTKAKDVEHGWAVAQCDELSICGTECITVSYVCGSGIPAGGKHAARVLAEEMLSGMTGGPCQLPERVTSVTRQGMSFTLLDPQDFLDKGRTGLYAVDLFLRAANPRGALRPARVFIPTSRGRSCGCGARCNCGGN